MAASEGIPKMEQAIGMSNSDPPATPEAPQAATDASTDSSKALPMVISRPIVLAAANVMTVRASEDCLTVTVNLDDVIQTQKMRYPCLITVEKDANTPRLPSFRRKFATGDGAVKVLTADDLEGTDAGRLGLKGSPTRVERIFPPESSDSRELFEGTSAELAEGLYSVLKSRKFL